MYKQQKAFENCRPSSDLWKNFDLGGSFVLLLLVLK